MLEAGGSKNGPVHAWCCAGVVSCHFVGVLISQMSLKIGLLEDPYIWLISTATKEMTSTLGHRETEGVF